MRNVAAVILCVLILPAVSLAQTGMEPVDQCQVDSDCPDQFECELVETPCDPSPCTCACQPCDPDDESCECVCPECDVVACEGYQYRVCTWIPDGCTDDGDCPDGFECSIPVSCSGQGACECPPCACPPEAGDACDCSNYSCECEDIVEPECVSGEGFCAPAMKPCDGDSDCPEDFKCTSFSGDTDCGCGCACPACDGDNCEPCECPPCGCGDVGQEETVSYCVPGGWENYVQLEGGEAVFGTREGDDTAGVPLQDLDGNNTEVGGGDSGNCSSGAPGRFSLILLLPLGILIARRRHCRRS